MCEQSMEAKESMRGNKKQREQLYYSSIIESKRGNCDRSGKLYGDVDSLREEYEGRVKCASSNTLTLLCIVETALYC